MAHNFLIILAILAFELLNLEAAPNFGLSRIVNGQDAAVGQFPHQIALLWNGKFHCGGSILKERYILTAAHCVLYEGTNKPLPVNNFQIRAGSVSRSSGGQLLNVKRIIIHEDFKADLNLDNIALLELENPLEWSDNVKPIEMATEEIASDEDIIISGWGATTWNGPSVNHLQWTTLKSLATKKCLKFYRYVDHRVICLHHPLNYGACRDDSGSAATYKGKLVGVSGYQEDCGHLFPNVYAKVFHYHKWILKQMNEEVY